MDSITNYSARMTDNNIQPISLSSPKFMRKLVHFVIFFTIVCTKFVEMTSNLVKMTRNCSSDGYERVTSMHKSTFNQRVTFNYSTFYPTLTALIFILNLCLTMFE